MGKQPVLERLLLHREAVEEIALVESGRLGERRRGRLGRPELELVHVHRHRARIESDRLAVHHEGLRISVAQALAERIERLPEACPRGGLDRVTPEQARQLVSGVGRPGGTAR